MGVAELLGSMLLQLKELLFQVYLDIFFFAPAELLTGRRFQMGRPAC